MSFALLAITIKPANVEDKKQILNLKFERIFTIFCYDFACTYDL